MISQRETFREPSQRLNPALVGKLSLQPMEPCKCIQLKRMLKLPSKDDLKAFLELRDEHDIPYSNFGNTFSKEWYQVFFQDPANNIIEVHQETSG